MDTERKVITKKPNSESVKSMFHDGAVWAGKTQGGELLLQTVDVVLEPGTYEVKEGDTLRLIGFMNKFKTDPDTGEVNNKKPDFILRVKNDRQ